MKSLLHSCLLAVVVAAARAADPSPAPAAPQVQPLPVILAQTRLSPDAIEGVFDGAILADGAVDKVAAQLDVLGKDAAQPAHFRSNAYLLASHLQWKFGKLPAATAAADRALAIETTGELLLHKGRLMEAAAKLGDARKFYEQAAQTAKDPQDIENARIELTMLDTTEQNVGTLVALAKSRDSAFRNRAAVALSLLKQPGEAADLYEVTATEATARQRQHLRLAQWALAAGQAKKAQNEAWESAQESTLPRDIRYSLSILVEAYELDGSWDRLLARLAGLKNPSPDYQAMRAEVLRRLGRFDEAIAVIGNDRGLEASAEGQHQLLRIYSQAGKNDAMEAEYRRLMAKEPAETAWPRGLSEHFLENGKHDEARKVWQDFTQHNDDMEVLLAGGEAMSLLGLDELALAAADKCESLHPDSTVRVMWFRFNHYLRRGHAPKAEDVLAQIDKELPPDASGRTELADAYEQIRKPKQAIVVWENLAKNRQGGLGSEERMRLAWLYDSVGRRDDAIATWRNLWDGDLPPARRKMVEDRMLLLAAETGTIGDIAIDLEKKLADGTAEPKYSSLLIRIYIAAGDTASAIEVIHEYYNRQAKTPALETKSLQEQAMVYNLIGRPKAFNRVEAKLADLDPADRTDYLESMILNHISVGEKDDKAEVLRLLPEVRKADPGAGDEFEAGVLVLAGMQDKAEDAYWKALARNPGHGDDYLLLTDLYKQTRQTDEAAAVLQYFAETAPGDDGFIEAIDGILNILPPADSPLLKWAKRRVLERVAENDDKFYLYDLASELADETRDAKGYLAALEDSLVDAGPRRTSVLREMFTATDGKAPSASQNDPVSLPDPKRNLTYGRRLVAMGEEMPPEVYLDIGQTFLKLGRPDEALDSFNLAIDRSDRPEFIEQSADKFRAAGYNDQATVLYERSLTAQPDNIGVMSKLASIRNTEGEVAGAQEIYSDALVKLADQQLTEVEGGKVDVGGEQQKRQDETDKNLTFGFKDYFQNLERGFLFTLPADKSGAPSLASIHSAESQFNAAYQEVGRRTGGKPSQPLAEYPQLDVLSRLVRYAALHAGLYDMADRVDSKILRYFGGDDDLATGIIQQRLDWGLRKSAADLLAIDPVSSRVRSAFDPKLHGSGDIAPLISITAAARQEAARRDFRLAVQIAQYAGNEALAFGIYRDWVNSVAAPIADDSGQNNGAANAAAARAFTDSAIATALVMSGMPKDKAPVGDLAPIAADAQARLSKEDFAALCRQIAGQVAAKPELGATMVSGAPAGADAMQFVQARLGRHGGKSILLTIEQVTGAKLLTRDQLNAAVAAFDKRQLQAFDADYVYKALPAADCANLFIRQLDSETSNLRPIDSQACAPLALLLSQPLDAASTAKVLAAIRPKLEMAAQPGEGRPQLVSGQDVANAFMPVVRTLNPANAGFLTQLDAYLKDYYAGDFPNGLRAFTPGNRPRAAAAGNRGRGRAGVAAKANVAQEGLDGVIDGALEFYKTLDPSFAAQVAQSELQNYVAPLARQIYPAQKAALFALLDKRAEADLSPALFSVTLAFYLNDPAANPREEVAWLERVIKDHPDLSPALEILYPIYHKLGDPERERQILERLVALQPDQDGYRWRLANLWRKFDQPENVLKAIAGHPGLETSEDPNIVVMGGDWNRDSRLEAEKLTVTLARATSADQGRPALRTLLQSLPPSAATPADWGAMRESGIIPVPYGTLFGLKVPSKVGEGSGGAFVDPLLKAVESEDSDHAQSLMTHVAGQPYALADLEAIFRTLDPEATDYDSQYEFYPVLADAYATSGRLQSEFTRLSGLIQAGTAGKKDVLLWMELALRQPETIVKTLSPMAEKAIGESGSVGDYERLQIARLFGRAGRQDQALEAYGVLAVRSYVKANQGMMAARNQPAIALGVPMVLCGDAAKYLDAGHFAKLVFQLSKMTEPTGAVPGGSEWHERFNLWLIDRGLKAGVSPDALKPLLSAAGSGRGRQEDRVRYAEVMYRYSTPDQALAAFKNALGTEDTSVDPANHALALGQGWSVYAVNLGFKMHALAFLTTGALEEPVDPGALALFNGAIPTTSDGQPGAHDWLIRVSQALPGWIAASEANREIGLEVLTLTALREHQMGMPEAAATMRSISGILSQCEISDAVVSFAVAVANETSTPIDADVTRKLVERGLVDAHLVAGLVRAEAGTDAARAMALGETALQYTRNDDLLDEMETLARKVGKDADAARFKAMRSTADQARSELEHPEMLSVPETVS